MFKSSSFYMFYVILIAYALIARIVASDDDDDKIRDTDTPQNFNFKVPDPFREEEPLFETDYKKGRYIHLHLPYVLDMEFHCRGGPYSTKFSLAFLTEIFRVLYDRKPLEDGSFHGPVMVSLFGIPVIDNEENKY